MKRVVLFIFLILLSFFSFGQTSLQKKEYTAIRISSSPKIDALLDDSCWLNVPAASDFTQMEPNPGAPSRYKTEIKIIYDDKAIYVGALMYDPHPDSILCELSKRDNVFFGPNADAFGFIIDAYRDGQNGVFIGVTSCGVQTDTKISDPDNFDDSWNVAWESKVAITDKGWIAEIKIPYSVLRFPKKEIQEWGLNFFRQVKRYKEQSSWNSIDPEEQGMIHQSGILNGIENIKSPLRLSLSPYVSAYADSYNGKSTTALNGGADIKYGINESFTMDMTLIPDFGQVRSDDKVLNLSPYEVRYNEQRSFFNEGTELFNKIGLLYSRRIGGQPLGYESAYDQQLANETVEKNPASSQLYNAVKISGRTKKKSGLGLFNAVSAPTYATLLDTVTDGTRKVLTHPLTNYNVLVFDQGMKNNSFICFTNTNVTREGNWRDANVTGMQFKLNNKANSFSLNGGANVSQVFFPDSAKPELGEYYRVSIGKISGNYQSNLTYRVKGKKYDPNDLGYLERNNEAAVFFNHSYNIFKPFWKINKMSNELGIDYYMQNVPRTYTRLHLDWNTNVEFKNYYSAGLGWAIEPFGLYDYVEPRVEGRYFVRAPFYGAFVYFATDERKRLRLEGSIGEGILTERNRHNIEWSVSPRYRFSDKFTVSYWFNNSTSFDDAGWADNVNDTIIFGVRDVNTKENTLEGNYIFTSTMSLSLRARHYWSQVKYKDYFTLNEQGKASTTSYSSNNNINFNAITVDMVYTWQFAPASEMSIVWKNAIFTEGQQLIYSYWNNFNKTFESPQLNSFSIKILYYLDYQDLKRKR